jgi:hypothetical protein
MAKKQKTFADRAKRIMDKYSDRPGDAMSKEALNRELGALKAEQESDRAAMMEGEAAKINASMSVLNSMGYGGNMQYANGGPMDPSKDPRAAQTQLSGLGFDVAVDGIWGPQSQTAFDQYNMQKQNREQTMTPMAPKSGMIQPGQGDLAETQPNMFATLGESYMQGDQGSYQGQEFNPWITAAQGAGDVLGLAQSLRPTEDRDYGRLGFEATDTSEAQKAIDQQTATGRLNLRAMQRSNPNAALSSQIAGNVGLSEAAGRGKAGLIQQTANQDIMRKQQVDQFNMGVGMQEQEANFMTDDARKMAQVQHLQNLGQTVAGGYGDAQRQGVQTDIVGMMGDNYRYITDKNGRRVSVPRI